MNLSRVLFQYFFTAAGTNVVPYCHAAAAAVLDDSELLPYCTCLEVRNATALIFRLSNTIWQFDTH